MSHPVITVCIPIHNALEYLKTCLDELNKNTENFLLVLVNDYSNEETTNFVFEYARAHPAVVVHRTIKQQWFTRASNLGLRYVRTPLAVLLNSDTIPREGWLDELYEVSEEFKTTNPEKKFALVGSVQDPGRNTRWSETYRGVRGAPEYVTGHCWLVDMEAMEFLAMSRGTPKEYLNEKDPAQIHIASDRIGCWDLNNLGYSTLISWKAKVDHHGGKSWDFNLNAIPKRIEDVQ